jgi:hypothetical protein
VHVKQNGKLMRMAVKKKKKKKKKKKTVTG